MRGTPRLAAAQPVYRPRDAEHSVLYGLVREHLDDFLRAAGAHEDGAAPRDRGRWPRQPKRERGTEAQAEA